MKKYLWLVILVLLVPMSVWAQPNRSSTVDAFAAKFGLPDNSNDAARAAWTDKVAETLAAKFPGDGWGRKRNGPGREANADVIAIRPAPGQNYFLCVDILNGTNGQNYWNVVNPPCASPPQEFIEVTPHDWLAETPPNNPPDIPPADTTLPEALARLEAKLAQLEALVRAIPPCTIPSVAFPVYEGVIRVPYLGSAPITLTPKK